MNLNTDVCIISSVILNNQNGLRALCDFSIGAVISSFGAKVVLTTPNYLTVQLGEEQHITLVPEWLQYVNHSCNPNAFFNIETMTLDCVRPISKGDEITFFYPSTEWEMNQPFICKCNSVHCLGFINGAKAMDKSNLATYRLSPFVLRKLQEHA